MKNTNNTNNFQLDSATLQLEDHADLLDFLETREDEPEWIESRISGCQIIPEKSNWNGLCEQAVEEAVFTIDVFDNGQRYLLRDIATPSLLERARINGYALSELSSDEFADIVTKCLKVSNDTMMLRLQDGKVGAFMASTYKILPQPQIYQACIDTIRNQNGRFVKCGWCHSVTASEYSVSTPSSDYLDLLQSKGLNYEKVETRMTVVTSDTGYSGVNIYPSVYGVGRNGMLFKIPIMGEITMPHKGKASMEEFINNLSLTFAQSKKSVDKLRSMDKIVLNFPFNTLCNVLKKVGISKKTAMNVLERFAVIYGNTSDVSATDLYLAACELLNESEISDDNIQSMKIAENIAKILKISENGWSEYDKPLNCWKINITM